MLGDIILSFTPQTLETPYNELWDSHECRHALLLTMQQAVFLCWWCSGETVFTQVQSEAKPAKTCFDSKM